MSFHVHWAIFSSTITGNPFYSGRVGNWWVPKMKFPTRAAIYCENDSYWNVSSGLSVRGGWIWEQYCAHSQELMCSRLERNSLKCVEVFGTMHLTGDKLVYHHQMVSCSVCRKKTSEVNLNGHIWSLFSQDGLSVKRKASHHPTLLWKGSCYTWMRHRNDFKRMAEEVEQMDCPSGRCWTSFSSQWLFHGCVGACLVCKAAPLSSTTWTVSV